MDKTELIRLVAQRLRANGVAWREIVRGRDGREHYLFRVVLGDGQVRIAKFAREDPLSDPNWPERTPLRALEAEQQALSLVRGVRVPHSYTILPGEPPMAIMEMLPGYTPEEHASAGWLDPEMLDHVCYEMGSVLANIHSVRRPGEPGAITDLPGADPATARLLHMDFHFGNIVGNVRLGRRWKPEGVIDWTCCHWGPREADFAEMGASVFASNPTALDPFLAGYRHGSSQALDPVHVLKWVGKELVRRMREDPPTEESVRNLWLARIQQWVAPADRVALGLT